MLAILVTVPACKKGSDTSDDDNRPSDEQTTTPQGELELILSETSMVIGVGQTKRLTVRNSLTNMETSGVLWVSENKSIATIDTSGYITGVSEGTTTITVSNFDGTVSSECMVTVTAQVADITLRGEDKIVLEVGDSKEFAYDFTPENVAPPTVTWSSSNPSVATVSPHGVVTAHADGDTTIMVQTEDGKFDYCTVEVITPVKQVQFEISDLNLAKGKHFLIEYTLIPANATYQNLTWTSKNDAVATVSNGRVFATGAGSTIIQGTAHNEVYAQLSVNVKASVSSVSISHQRLDLVKGDEWQLTADVIPADATNQKVTWRSSDSSIATVSQSGIVTARKTGEVVISVITEDGNHNSECKVYVTNPLKSIVLDKVSITLSIYDAPVTLVPTFDPIDADDLSDAVWSTKDRNVAIVDENGVVKAVAPGQTTIVLSTLKGIYAECEVIVPSNAKVPVSSISVTKRYVTLRPGEIHIPDVTLYPAEASDKTYILSSDNQSVVKVDADGKLVAVKKGSATITVASVSNPEITMTISIDVKELTQDEINNSIAKYTAAVTQENNRHASALAAIDTDYSYLVDLKNKLDTFDTQKAALEKNIAANKAALANAESAGNTELINQYTSLIQQDEKALADLKANYTKYDVEMQIYNEENANYKAEIAAENKLNTDNLDKINTEYAYILPFLPTT